MCGAITGGNSTHYTFNNAAHISSIFTAENEPCPVIMISSDPFYVTKGHI